MLYEEKKLSNFNPETPNQPVRQLSNPSVQGITTGRTRPLGTTLHVQVQVSVNDIRYIPFDDLEANIANSTGIEDLLDSLKFGKVGDLARILTFHKISSNLSNVFYAMQASRTDFYSYQFKPVYKYIESLNGRILIADEVGLGKTIEAGLIWQETKARHPEARRLLVVCPSMLRDKWKKELKDRFDVKAEIYDTKGFIGLLEDFQREGLSFECAAICSLTTIRQDRILEAINEMHEAHRFDLVIIDEAHHLRNSETKSHHAGLLLSDATDSMVLLTATPIHLGSEDLYRLLRLLDANEFSDLEIFRQRIEENEPLVRAQNLIRRYPPQIDQALDELEELKHSEWFRDSELLALTQEQLNKMKVDDDTTLIEVGRRLEKLNLFSSVISRTRKREVLENRVIRQAQSISLEFTPEEREFYEAVTESVQKRMEGFAGNSFSGFAVMMPQRMMASSIPAMVEHYRQYSELDEDLLDAMGVLSDDLNSDEKNGEIWLSLEQVVKEWDLNHPDSKYEKLREVLENRFNREPQVKIIIFSFFKKTLQYLHRRLAKEGFAPLKIDGSVPMEERQEIILNFRTDPGRRILLSSEVGSEGIDLQFCRVMVNYDLPWNPMKVEQRIGRIDRIGQKAERINILNFAVARTIEEKILSRLYERIGIFEKSLGDLEPILGELSEKLHNELLSRRLTEEEREQKIRQTMLAFENRRQEEENLVEQSAVFLGSSDYILQQIGRARTLGRWITPKDLSGFTEDFFQSFYQGTTVQWDKPTQGLVSIKLTNQARNDLYDFCRLQYPPLQTSLSFGNSDNTTLVYEPELAQENPRLEMLSHFHPLIKWICDRHQKNENAFYPTSAVHLKSELVEPSNYLIIVQFWIFTGTRKETRIEYAMIPLEGNLQTPESAIAEKIIQEILVHGKNWQFADLSLDLLEVNTAWHTAAKLLAERNQQSFNEFSRENEELRHRRYNYLRAFGERKNEIVSKAIETLSQKLQFTFGEKERARVESQIKGNKTKLANQKAVLETKLRELEKQSRPQNEFRDVAAVICQIKK